MQYLSILKGKLALLIVAVGAICLSGETAQATHGGSDPFHYSDWSTGWINFTVAGQNWGAISMADYTANPDVFGAYFCQKFGFYNCQVTGPTDTWVRAAAKCKNSGGTQTDWIYTAWSRSVPTVSCPSSYPYIATAVYAQVASIPYVF